eukprot:2592301-Prymnesium_polylepis.1
MPPQGSECESAWTRISATLCPQVKAYRKTRRGAMSMTDESYAHCICIRSMPLVRSGRGAPGGGAMQMSSINEDFLLAQLGLPRTERNLIEGLQTRRISSADANSGFGLTEEQLSSRAVARLTANPSPKVGHLQRRTAKQLVRPCESCHLISRPKHRHSQHYRSHAHSTLLQISKKSDLLYSQTLSASDFRARICLLYRDGWRGIPPLGLKSRSVALAAD